jgi:Zn-dependent protease with chaperone function
LVSETWYPGLYFEGPPEEARAVSVALAQHGIAIQLEDGGKRWWPFEKVRSRRVKGAIEFETSQTVPEKVVIEDPAFLAALETVNPGVAQGQTPGGMISLIGKLCMLFASLGGLLFILIVWGLPWMAGAMARMVPVSVEEQIGQAALEAFAPKFKRCADPALQSIVERLESSVEGSPYRFRVYVVEDGAVNAFAAPGGYIVVFRGLLNRTRTAEEVASVLAHEMQHVVQRHGVRGMMRGLSIGVLLSLLTGNPGDTVAGLGGAMGSLAYQRRDEADADGQAFRMLVHARIRPLAMIDMLQKLEEVQGEMPGAQYFSSHPLTKDRIRSIERMAAKRSFPAQLLLPGQPWPPPTASCRMGL